TAIPLERIRTLVHHNHYLSLLTETGFIGFSLFIGMIGVWAVDAWKMVRHTGTPDWIRGIAVLFLAMLSVILFQWMGHELSYSPIDHSLLFLLAGMTAGLRPQAFRVQQESLAQRAAEPHADDVNHPLPVLPV
ncbi:MAG: hypothetical protein HON53_09270, partial [Planctomycetaceae bacterium]|nr:hypothetical protein [Planctomycetaceae bacterium]